MKKLLIFCLAKILIFLQSFGKGGTSFPGQLALRLKADILRDFKLPEESLLVTGTNGKTSTANTIAGLCRAAGYRVCHNSEGANMAQGILTQLLKSANHKLEVQADFLVLEVDELTLVKLASQLKPKTVLLTNLFDDQVDRYGDKLDLADKLAAAIPNQTCLLVNGDDPSLVYLAHKFLSRSLGGPDQVLGEAGDLLNQSGSLLGQPNEMLARSGDLLSRSGKEPMPRLIYYGLAPASLDKDKRSSFTDISCPVCGKSLKYSEQYYEGLGKFTCSCGFASPKLNFAAENISLDRSKFSLSGQNYHFAHGQIYQAYNLLAALIYGSYLGLDPQLMAQAASCRPRLAGRFEHLPFGGHEAWLNLVKNPAGLNQSLAFISGDLSSLTSDQKAEVFIGFNRQPADGRDGSWISSGHYDLLLKPEFSRIYLAGELADDLEKVLLDQGFQQDSLVKVSDLKLTLGKLAGSSTKPYFLSNFTYLSGLREAILKMP